MKISQLNENIKAIIVLDKSGLVNTYYKNFEEVEKLNVGNGIVKIFNPTPEKLSKMIDLIQNDVSQDNDGQLEISNVDTVIELIKLFTDLELDEDNDVIERKLDKVEFLRVIGREVGRIPVNYISEVFKNIKDYGNMPEELRKFSNTIKEINNVKPIIKETKSNKNVKLNKKKSENK